VDRAVTELIGPQLLGRSALDVAARRREVADAVAALEMDGVVGRAWSLVEICLQDLRAQSAGWPLWRLLGGDPRPRPVELVEGYALLDEADEAFAERLAARAAEGFRLLKIEAAHYDDPHQLCRRLERFRELCGDGPELVLDFAWRWESAKAKAPLLARLADLGVAWIEDPFPRTRIADYARLKALTTIAVGCGDEATRSADLAALIAADAVDVIRLDATTAGGVAETCRIARDALDRGLRASFHDHPEIHQHCAFAGASDHVEVFPTDRPFDRVHDLIEAPPFDRIRQGELAPPTEPGSGVRLRPDALQLAVRHSRVAA
jgi:L-alanine-DL-glutamate epimerase-like enolase superfamily enzyme